MISKYFHKTRIWITNGINYYDTFTQQSPLIRLLECEYVNNEWIQLYFTMSDQINVPIKQNTLLEAIEMCKNNQHLQTFQAAIEANYQKNYGDPDSQTSQ